MILGIVTEYFEVKLYHGTSSKIADKAIVEGIMPRSATKASNWDVKSNPNCVYLTNAYALYFAINACQKNGEFPAIMEIDTDFLNESRLVPDEDVLEQAGRGHDDLPKAWSMERRTKHYRDNLMHYSGGAWKKSLEAIGNCAYAGIIPSEAITRVVVIDHEKQSSLAMMGLDPSISLMNYRFTGDKYRQMTKWIFDNEMEDTETDKLYASMGAPTTLDILKKDGREGIKIVYEAL